MSYKHAMSSCKLGSCIDSRRIHLLSPRPARPGPVVYWMHREHRVSDNWALLYARELAAASRAPVAVVFCLTSTFLDATQRCYDFMLEGLRGVSRDLDKLSIPFFLRLGDPPGEIVHFVKRVGAGRVVTDFDPLRLKRQWLDQAALGLDVALEEVDSRNLVPCRAVSDKKEYAARTIRPKIHRLLPEFFVEPPVLEPNPAGWSGDEPGIDWSAAHQSVAADRSVAPVDWLQPGETAAKSVLKAFISKKLKWYAGKRNDPNGNAVSHLSPYLHFGHVSSQRIAWEVSRSKEQHGESAQDFLEELVVRRELSDNFCLHEPDYDSVEGFPNWARQTLDDHRGDERNFIYSQSQLDAGETHDPLWNAAQWELRLRGKMHGYMRMYWAKKMLEWTESPEEALRLTLWLNDRYELDGRDANGYTGAAWSVGGVHDRPWKERPVFGKIRYMNDKGCRRKFNVDAYIDAVALYKRNA